MELDTFSVVLGLRQQELYDRLFQQVTNLSHSFYFYGP